MTNRFFVRALAPLAVAAACLLAGCGSTGDTVSNVGLRAETPLPDRAGAVVVDGCVVDPWQRATLATPAARRVLSEVILLCLVPRETGEIGPRDPSARAHLAELAADLKRDGYRVHFGLAFTDESGQRYDGAQTRAFLEDPAWRARLVESLGAVALPADGVELDLQFLPDDARPLVTSLVTELSASLRPARRLGVFVPPSVTIPSDLPGGEAFSRRELAPLVDRMRIMTLDFSEAAPGPTVDPGWAVDAARLALGDARDIDVAYPLYGIDFGPRGKRPTLWHEAVAIAHAAGAPIERGPTGALFVRYVAFGGETHDLWFDDAESTGMALGAWTFDVIPSHVGVLFYGLGAEDPALWDRLASRMP
jgi:hypothetical protein